MVEDDTTNIFLSNSKGLETLNSFNFYTNPTFSYSNHWWYPSSSPDNKTATTADHAGDLSVFPPSNHENLVPTPFIPDPVDQPSPSSDSCRPSPPIVPRWWAISVQILRSRVANIWSCLGHNRRGGKGSVVWRFRSVGIAAAAVVGWWVWVTEAAVAAAEEGRECGALAADYERERRENYSAPEPNCSNE